MSKQTCSAQTGPVWKCGGERCGCVLPTGHTDDHRCSCGSWWVDSIRRDKECTCYPTDPATWTTYGSAVEPGSMYEPDPECPRHK